LELLLGPFYLSKMIPTKIPMRQIWVLLFFTHDAFFSAAGQYRRQQTDIRVIQTHSSVYKKKHEKGSYNNKILLFAPAAAAASFGWKKM